MKLLKNLFLFIPMVLLLLVFTSCNNNRDEVWYRTDMGEAQMNVLTISQKTNEGFYLKASCCNGANSGEFEGYFSFNSNNTATFSGKSFDGIEYTIIIEYEGELMKALVVCDETVAEHFLLGLGNAVTLSGEYSTQKPTFDYSEQVLEDVFLLDTNTEKAVREFLGKEEFDSFVRNFGISAIYQENVNGHTIIRGNLRGIGNWCSFCTTSNGYFYIINDYEYFSNDPIYIDTPPEFVM